MALKFNPMSGQFDFVNPKQTVVEAAEKIADVFNCDAAAVVGDVVVPSVAVTDKVDTLLNNVFPNLGFGVIIEKLSITTCKVLISGKLTGAAFGVSGLTFGKPVFIGTDGTLTTVVPTSGHIQKMGMALKSDTIFLMPSLEKVILA